MDAVKSVIGSTPPWPESACLPLCMSTAYTPVTSNKQDESTLGQTTALAWGFTAAGDTAFSIRWAIIHHLRRTLNEIPPTILGSISMKMRMFTLRGFRLKLIRAQP